MNLRPVIAANNPVDWWFVFKFNSEHFEGCDGHEKLPHKGRKHNQI